MREATLPPEIIARFGHLQYAIQRGQHEISSLCPKCGDSEHSGSDYPDRFRIFTNGKIRFWCRRCGFKGFADDNRKDFVITDEVRQQWLQERLEREEQARRSSDHALELLRHEQAYLLYQQQMDDYARGWWRSKGVVDWMLERFKLGYCASRSVWYHGAEYSTPTATIPVFEVGGELVNIRHRLIKPPEPNDKYRPERAGLPASLYLTEPEQAPRGLTILVEGEIKAIIVWAYFQESHRVTVVGVPGKNPRDELIQQLSECDPVYVALDPDAGTQAHQIAKRLGSRARIVKLPVKPDDFFVRYGGTVTEFEAAIKQSARVR